MDFINLIKGHFIRRENRFMGLVQINGESAYAHIANSGRLTGFLPEGAIIWLDRVNKKERKTQYDLQLVRQGNVLISLDARLPSKIFEEAVINKKIPYSNLLKIQREVRLDKSRIDILLSCTDGYCWIETKSVTLVEEGVAKFPDSPTIRGRRHLNQLRQRIMNGEKAEVVFIIQRRDADVFVPNTSIDPEFCAILSDAKSEGVVVRAFTCQVNKKMITIASEIRCNI